MDTGLPDPDQDCNLQELPEDISDYGLRPPSSDARLFADAE